MTHQEIIAMQQSHDRIATEDDRINHDDNHMQHDCE
jgi:hypothetical protein